MFTTGDGRILSVSAPIQEASQPLLSADRLQFSNNLPRPDVESQRAVTTPSVVVVKLAPNGSFAGVPVDVEGVELLRMERAVLLVPLSLVAHASITYSVVKYFLSLHQDHPTIRLIFEVYMAASLVVSFIFLLYLRCHTPQVRSEISQVLSRNDVASWTLFLFTELSLCLVVSTFAVLGFSTKLLFLSCGLAVSLLAAVCGLAHQPLVIPRPGFLSDNLSLKEYTGLFFPCLLYLAPIEFLFIEHKLPRSDGMVMVLEVVLEALGSAWCSVECTESGNKYITCFILFMIVLIAVPVLA